MAILYLVPSDYVPTPLATQEAEAAALDAAKAAAFTAGVALIVGMVNARGGPVFRWEMERALQQNAATYVLGKIARALVIRQAAIQLHGAVDDIPPLVEPPAEP